MDRERKKKEDKKQRQKETRSKEGRESERVKATTDQEKGNYEMGQGRRVSGQIQERLTKKKKEKKKLSGQNSSQGKPQPDLCASDILLREQHGAAKPFHPALARYCEVRLTNSKAQQLGTRKKRARESEFQKKKKPDLTQTAKTKSRVAARRAMR